MARPRPRPRIGISVDNRDNARSSGRYEVAVAYGEAVVRCGGVPWLLPHELSCVDDYVEGCDGLILTGGVDPDTTKFGCAMHDHARPMDPTRQQFELALLDVVEALAINSDYPVLGVCLGMQLMALRAGGKLDQYMPDTLETAKAHQNNAKHRVMIIEPESALFAREKNCEMDEAEEVVSYHQQAVAQAGQLRVVAKSSDGVIEAIDDPQRRFYGGVQWHPERGGAGAFSDGLISRLIQAARPRLA